MHGLSYAYLTQKSDVPVAINGSFKRIRELTLPGGGSVEILGCLVISLWNLFANKLSLSYKDFPKWWEITTSCMTGNYINSAAMVKPYHKYYGVILNMWSFPLNRDNYLQEIDRIQTTEVPAALFSFQVSDIAPLSLCGLTSAVQPSNLQKNAYFRAAKWLVLKLTENFIEKKIEDVLINSKVGKLVNIFFTVKKIYDIMSDFNELYEILFDSGKHSDYQTYDGHAIFSESMNLSDGFGTPTVDPLDRQDINGLIHPLRKYYRHYAQVIYTLIKTAYFPS